MSDGGRERREWEPLIFQCYVLCCMCCVLLPQLCVVHIFSPSIFNISFYVFVSLLCDRSSLVFLHISCTTDVCTHGSHTEFIFYISEDLDVLLLSSSEFISWAKKEFFFHTTFFLSKSLSCVYVNVCEIYGKILLSGVRSP